MVTHVDINCTPKVERESPESLSIHGPLQEQLLKSSCMGSEKFDDDCILSSNGQSILSVVDRVHRQPWSMRCPRRQIVHNVSVTDVGNWEATLKSQQEIVLLVWEKLSGLCTPCVVAIADST